MTEYAEKLKTYRISAGITQKQLGVACGYGESYADAQVRHWESGRSYPPIDKLRIIAKTLKVPLDNLIP